MWFSWAEQVPGAHQCLWRVGGVGILEHGQSKSRAGPAPWDIPQGHGRPWHSGDVGWGARSSVLGQRGSAELGRTSGVKKLEIWKGENYLQLRKMNQ